MNRINQKDLENAVEQLNERSQHCGDWYRVQYYNGSCRLTGARGSVDIQPMLGTKKECFYIVNSILNFIYSEGK